MGPAGPAAGPAPIPAGADRRRRPLVTEQGLGARHWSIGCSLLEGRGAPEQEGLCERGPRNGKTVDVEREPTWGESRYTRVVFLRMPRPQSRMSALLRWHTIEHPEKHWRCLLAGRGVPGT